MPDEQGVTAAESPTEGIQDVPAASSTAQGVPDSPTDRPVENWQREFQRRQQEQADKLEKVIMYLASGAQQPQGRKVDRQTAPEPPTDEELWAQAQQGDRVAFEEYQGRIAERKIAQNSQASRKQQIVAGQLQAIVAKYPVLNNPQHPLAQTMNQAYQLLVSNGYAAGPETLLEAAKTAIADRPDLVSDLYTQNAQAREQVRQDSTRRAQSGVMSGSHRQSAPSGSAAPKISPEAADLARRMGVKDPDKAMERFRKRQAAGQSSFGSVAAFIPQEDQ